MKNYVTVAILTLALIGASATAWPRAQAPATPTQLQQLQFVYGAVVEAGVYAEMRTGPMDPMSYVEHGGLRLPYTAPPGYRIGITGLCLASKMNDRSSYLTVPGVYSHADRAPCTTFPAPLWLIPTAVLSGTIINNSGTRQYMIGTIHAVVAPIH